MLSEDRSLLLDLYKQAVEQHTKVLADLACIQNNIRGTDKALLVDAILALKHSSQYIEDTRKSIDRTLNILQRIGCYANSVDTQDDRLVGEWATGYGQVTEQPGVPHPEKEPEQYKELMEALGVPEEIIAQGTLRPSFDAIGQLSANLGAQGKPLPKAFAHAKLIPRYTVVVREKHKNLLNDLVEGVKNV